MEEQVLYQKDKASRQELRKDRRSAKKSEFDSTNLVTFLYRKRRILFITGIAAIIVSSIAAILIPNKFKSEVVLFPTSTSSVSKALLSQNPGSNNDLMKFGEEEEAEQMLQVLNSDKIRNRIIEKYDLMHHYDIDTTSPIRNTLLHKEYESNINFRRTEFMSVVIEVLDQDPQMASFIANDIAQLVDTVRNEMQRARAIQAFQIVKAEYDAAVYDIRTKEDSLQAIMNMGVYDYESQSEVLYEQYAIALARGDERVKNNVKEKLDILAKYGPTYISLRDHLEHQRKQLIEVKSKYDEAKVDAEQNITTKFIVSSAVPAERKSYPVRWLIVAVSTLSTLLFTVVLLVLIDMVRKEQHA